MLEANNVQISFLSNGLNSMFYGGFHSGKIYEICGPPGIGKTQACLQLCAHTILHETTNNFKTNQAFNLLCLRDAVYIDTESSSVTERFKEILKNSFNFEKYFQAHLNASKSLLKTDFPDNKSPTFGKKRQIENCATLNEDLDKEKDIFAQKLLGQNLHYFCCKDHTELIALLVLLPNYMDKYPTISLIIVDSMAFVLQIPYHKIAQKNKILNTINQKFMNILTPEAKSKVTIMYTNQVLFGENDSESLDPHDRVINSMTPCLGDVWSQTSHIRILLYFYDSKRYAKVLKAPYNTPKSAIPFEIDKGGITTNVKSNAYF